MRILLSRILVSSGLLVAATDPAPGLLGILLEVARGGTLILRVSRPHSKELNLFWLCGGISALSQCVKRLQLGFSMEKSWTQDIVKHTLDMALAWPLSVYIDTKTQVSQHIFF